MNWIEITIRTTTAGAEVVSGMLLEAGINGAMIEDKADALAKPEGRWDMLDEEVLRRMEDDVKVTAYLPADAHAQDTVALLRSLLADVKRMALGFDTGKLTLETGSVDEEDWAECWKKEFHPFRLGERFVVKPTWTDYEARPGDRIIKIDPGMAFGSGTHETTAMCVGLLEAYVRPGDRVIDVGCGTGILAIAAAMAGAGAVEAIDIDALAVRIAGENVALNGLTEKIHVSQGDLLAGQAAGQADIVVANIIAAVIVSLAAPVRGFLKPGGLFICSGIARERADEVREALRAAGYGALDVRENGEWTAIAARS